MWRPNGATSTGSSRRRTPVARSPAPCSSSTRSGSACSPANTTTARSESDRAGRRCAGVAPADLGSLSQRQVATGRKPEVPDTITITDDRTGKKVTVPLTDGAFASSALRELDPDLRLYDPAYLSTAACASSITFLDGDNGILRHRGYPIEQLAAQSTYLEVAYLLLNGELPNKVQLEQWKFDVTHHTIIHENMRKRFVDGFHYDAHPVGMFVSAVAALGTFYKDAKDIFDLDSRQKQILRLIAKMPTLAAMCHRFCVGLPYVYPDNTLSFPGNFLNMMWRVGEYE